MQMFITTFLIIIQIAPSKYPSTDEWIGKLWYIHKCQYSAITGNNQLIPTTPECISNPFC